MDSERTQPLTDESLDLEIQSALAVDPLPDFRNRVRMRIYEESIRAAWGVWWAPAATAAIASVVLVSLVALRMPSAEKVAGLPPRELVTPLPESIPNPPARPPLRHVRIMLKRVPESSAAQAEPPEQRDSTSQEWSPIMTSDEVIQIEPIQVELLARPAPIPIEQLLIAVVHEDEKKEGMEQ